MKHRNHEAADKIPAPYVLKENALRKSLMNEKRRKRAEKSARAQQGIKVGWAFRFGFSSIIHPS